MNRLKQHSDGVTRLDMMAKQCFANVMQMPALRHVVFSSGIGNKAVLDRKHMIAAISALELITGQKPIITRARTSIDQSKLRSDMPIGCKVTVRGENAYCVADHLINHVSAATSTEVGSRKRKRPSSGAEAKGSRCARGP